MTPPADRLVLPDNIGFHIRMAQMRMFREYYRTFEGSGLTPGLHTALVIIRDNPGMRQGALAEPLMVHPTNITLLITKLDKAGLVSRQIEKSDRRAFHLYLTGRGKQLLDAMQDRLDALEQKLLGNLDEQERMALRQALDRIPDRGGEPSSETGLDAFCLLKHRPTARRPSAARRPATGPTVLDELTSGPRPDADLSPNRRGGRPS